MFCVFVSDLANWSTRWRLLCPTRQWCLVVYMTYLSVQYVLTLTKILERWLAFTPSAPIALRVVEGRTDETFVALSVRRSHPSLRWECRVCKMISEYNRSVILSWPQVAAVGPVETQAVWRRQRHVICAAVNSVSLLPTLTVYSATCTSAAAVHRSTTPTRCSPAITW